MIEQRTPEWRRQRAGLVTGSSVGAILGLNPWSSSDDVLRRMVREANGIFEEFSNVATEYGTFHEEFALADFELDTSLVVNEVGFCVHPEHEWLGASPDGLIGDYAVIEVKCPYGKRQITDKSEFKFADEQPHYYAQMQIEMICTGRDICYFYQWASGTNRLEIVKLNNDWVSDALPKLKAFYDLYLSELDNPAHLEPLVKEIPHHLAADEYRMAKRDMDEAKEKLERAKAQLIEAANGKKSKIGGLSVYQVDKAGSVSYSKIVKEHCGEIDLEPYRSKASSYWVVK